MGSGASRPEAAGPGDKLRGVTVLHLLTDFKDEIQRDATLLDSVKTIVNNVLYKPGTEKSTGLCPFDGKEGCAYVNRISKRRHALKSTHMLSYTWASPVNSILDALEFYCFENKFAQDEVCMWICCLCMNQYRLGQVSHPKVRDCANLEKTLTERVVQIGRVLTLMEPWNKPNALERAWCIFEIQLCINEPSVTLEFLTTASEASSLRDTILKADDVNRMKLVWQALSLVNIRTAKATLEEDRGMILDALGQKGLSHEDVNVGVTRKLRECFASALSRLVRKSTDATIGDFLAASTVSRCCGNVSTALDLSREALEREAGTSKEVAELCLEVALCMRECKGGRNFAEELKYLEKAKQKIQAQNELEGEPSILMGKVLTNIGMVYTSMEEFEKALGAFEECEKFLHDAGSTGGFSMILLQTRKGQMHLLANAPLQADTALEEAFKIFNLQPVDDRRATPLSLALMQTLGRRRWEQGKLQDALDCFELACSIERDLGLLVQVSQSDQQAKSNLWWKEMVKDCIKKEVSQQKEEKARKEMASRDDIRENLARSGGSCISNAGKVLLSDGSRCPIEEVRRNHQVWTPEGPAEVLCVLRAENAFGCRRLCDCGSRVPFLTEGHPVWQDGQWRTPKQLGTSANTRCAFLTNLVLSKCHLIDINGVLCATAGNGPHSLSQSFVLETLQQHPQWNIGIITLLPTKRQQREAICCRHEGQDEQVRLLGQLLMGDGDLSITPELLKTLHRTCGERLGLEGAFRWEELNAFVEGFVPPKAAEVQELVASYAEKTQQLLDMARTQGVRPTEVAAFCMWWIVAIHPFADGNGRVSRAFAALILGSTGLGDAKKVLAAMHQYFRNSLRPALYEALGVAFEQLGQPNAKTCSRVEMRGCSKLAMLLEVFVDNIESDPSQVAMEKLKPSDATAVEIVRGLLDASACE